MHALFDKLDFANVPFPCTYKEFVSKEYEGKLFRPPSSDGPPLISRGGQGLGDVISTIQFAYHVSELYLQPVGISWKARKPKEILRAKTEEAIPALGPNFEDRVFLSDEVWCNYGKAMWPWYYAVPYFNAHKTWQPNDSRVAVLQLDGKTKSRNKNLPPEQVPELEAFLKDLGYEVKHLQFLNDDGTQSKLSDWVDTLSKAEIFFGVCSGGLHMAHCVDIPKIAFTNTYDESILNPKESSHRNESFVHFKDFYEMRDKIT